MNNYEKKVARYRAIEDLLKMDTFQKTVDDMIKAELPGSGTRDFSIPLISGKIAMLRIPFPMSEADYEQLAETLRAWRKALVKA